MDTVTRMFKCLDMVLYRITRGGWQLAGICVILMAFTITFNVISRYVFNNANAQAFVLTCVFMSLCVALSVAHTQRLEQHLRVDLIDRYASEKVKRIFVNLIGPLFGLICIAILTWKSWQPFWFAFESMDTQGSGLARWPTWPWRGMVTIGAGFLTLTLLSQVIRFFTSLKKNTSK